MKTNVNKQLKCCDPQQSSGVSITFEVDIRHEQSMSTAILERCEHLVFMALISPAKNLGERSDNQKYICSRRLYQQPRSNETIWKKTTLQDKLYIKIFDLAGIRWLSVLMTRISPWLTMTVLELPPSESWSSLVSFEFLYGICVLLPSTNAEITFPRVERDRLICVASFNLWPVAPVLACLSEPCAFKENIKQNKQLSQKDQHSLALKHAAPLLYSGVCCIGFYKIISIQCALWLVV